MYRCVRSHVQPDKTIVSIYNDLYEATYKLTNLINNWYAKHDSNQTKPTNHWTCWKPSCDNNQILDTLPFMETCSSQNLNIHVDFHVESDVLTARRICCPRPVFSLGKSYSRKPCVKSVRWANNKETCLKQLQRTNIILGKSCRDG